VSDKIVFRNEDSGETLVRQERADGKHDLFVETGRGRHGHSVLDSNGNPSFIRDTDGRIIADDRQ